MKLSTLYELRKAYARETSALRGRYLDAVQGKDWHETTDALINGSLGEPRKPRGKSFIRLCRINDRAAQQRFLRGAKLSRCS